MQTEDRTLAVIEPRARTFGHLKEANWNDHDLEVIRETLCPGIDDSNLKLFAHQCERLGLDPFSRQIYVIKRGAYEDGVRVDRFTIQTGVDGFRLIADRTGNYRPGEITYHGRLQIGDDTYPESATATIYKFVRGDWYPVTSTAYFEEYAQLTKTGTPTSMWKTKPRVMLGKCAEVLAIRRGFPAELSGIYATEEMEQADNEPNVRPAIVREEPPKWSKPVVVESKASGARPAYQPGNGTPATESQVKAMYAIARNERQLDETKFRQTTRMVFESTPENLTKPQASEVIDRLKAGNWPDAAPDLGTPLEQSATSEPEAAPVEIAGEAVEFANDWSKKRIRDLFVGVDIHGNEQKDALKTWIGRKNVNGINLSQAEADRLIKRLEAGNAIVETGVRHEAIHTEFANWIGRENATLYNATDEEITELLETLEEAESADEAGDAATETDPGTGE